VNSKSNVDAKVNVISNNLFNSSYQSLCKDNDRVFAIMLMVQWIGSVIAALVISPRTWLGSENSIHFHVLFATMAGAILTVYPVYRNLRMPGAVANRYINVIAQGLYSVLLIHLTGGRIETHFHVFGSLAFFAFYRDLKVLAVGTVIVAVDHLFRGIWYPQSVFGVFNESPFRWIEHAGWVVFEDIFLGFACFRGLKEMKTVAHSEAQVTMMHEKAEELVQLRTKELEVERNQLKKTNDQISTIYNNVKSGFLLVDRDLKVLPGFTKSCHFILEKKVSDATELSKLLELGGRGAEHFNSMLEQVFDDLMPEEINLDQIPKRLKLNSGRYIKLEGSVVRNAAGEVAAVLFTVTDITDLARTEFENHRNLSIIQALQHMDVFQQFIERSRVHLVDAKKALTGENANLKSLKLTLHTLKGNLSAFELKHIADIVHEIEEKQDVAVEDINIIDNNLREYITQNQNILGLSYDEKVERKYHVTETQIDEISHMANSGSGAVSAGKILAWAKAVQYKTVEETLGPLKKMGAQIANRLGKQVEITLKNPNVRLDTKYLDSLLQTLGHLVRNSIDHGIEAIHDRANKGVGHVNIAVDDSGPDWKFEIYDDGKGIDTDRVVKKAIQMGILSAENAEKLSQSDKMKLVFEQGLSTAVEVTDISGRGVGMSAVREAVTQLGGEMLVESEFGKGTKIVISVPKAIVNWQTTQKAS
jgi:signal transduction histidine kinase